MIKVSDYIIKRLEETGAVASQSKGNISREIAEFAIGCIEIEERIHISAKIERT